MFRDSAFGAKDKELTNFKFKNLNKNSIEVYRKFLDLFNPNHRYNGLSDLDLMQKLQVIKEDRVTIGGLLFFGKQDDINDLLIDFRIDYLEVPGTSYSDSPLRYSFRLSEEENLFMFYFAIIERIGKKIDIPFKMTSSGFATNVQPQFIAIREALVNLLMHSDYFSTQKPRIRVFTDRIEFMNPGALPKDLKSIINEDFSKPRNPIIARIFRTIKLAENAGSGFSKMFNGWFSGYKVKPECISDVDYYKITFPLVSKDEPENVTDDTGNVTDEHVKNTQETDQEERFKIILKLIRNNRYITVDNIANRLRVSSRTIKRDIKKLKDGNRITRIGFDNTGYWAILQNNNPDHVTDVTDHVTDTSTNDAIDH
jgi:ATP-dependent DNA helicase RecG